jgi:hypothetical protein
MKRKARFQAPGRKNFFLQVRKNPRLTKAFCENSFQAVDRGPGVVKITLADRETTRVVMTRTAGVLSPLGGRDAPAGGVAGVGELFDKSVVGGSRTRKRESSAARNL